MKRFLVATMFALLILTGALRAQTPPGPANIAGTLYASNFTQWTVASGNNGPYSWSSPQVCTGATSGGVTFKPFVVGSPIRIMDTATPGNSETVSPTAVNINGSGCQITVTPAHIHYSFYLTTATAGLQEAINYSNQVFGPASPASVVIVTPAWSILGGVTSMVTSALGSSNVTILDERSSVIVPYVWSGSAYVAQPFATGSSTVCAGDLSGTYPDCLVVKIQGNAVANTTPVQNAVPNWNVATNRYEISPLTLDQIGAAFAISSFTCSTCATVEIGATIASPTNFTATYTSAAVSGAVSDGTNASPMSPPNATSQSGSLAHSYTSAVAATQNFTLTAIAATTRTATQAINWVPRSFGGTGTGGSATSATASGNNAVLVGSTGTLTISYLGNSCTGQVYNVTTSGTQYVYLLLPCNVSNPTAGSFTTPGPTVFPMNTPTMITFTNQFGASVTMYLYRSVNSFFSGTNNIITVGP